MQDKLEKLKLQVEQKIKEVTNLPRLEEIEIEYFGRKDGKLNSILKVLKNLGEEEKKTIGKLANEIKLALTEKLEAKRRELCRADIASKLGEAGLDTSLPGTEKVTGSLSPLSLVQYELEDIFKSLGFIVLDGPEVESDYYNFESLNVPEHHPARDMQDTFYIKAKKGGATPQPKSVLRTQTSNVQVRAMQKYGAPLRCVAPGRVFRFEALDASHENTFNQFEGLMIEENLSITNLIATMNTLLKGIFKKEVKTRLRPGFFPFVEPGFELDMQCQICGGRGCSVCKQRGWVELLPCGMVHPNVLKAGGVDPEKYTGFAFGLGLTRLVMMRYGIDDIRLINGGDLRFTQQF